MPLCCMPSHWEVAMATTDDGDSKVVQKDNKGKKRNKGGWWRAGVNKLRTWKLDAKNLDSKTGRINTD